jgi:LmbE family N-acetylglucosaminyl deacetylase
MRTRTFAAALAAISMLCANVEQAAAQPAAEYGGAAGLGLSLRRLGVAKRVLMVGAHPDDEDTQLLAALALEQGADVAYLSLTRGEGGQNGIGPELHEALGLLRTEELLAARRVDGARQFFTRAYDFGYSRNAEETFRHWPREEVLRDVVYVVRRFRPDVIIPVFSGTPRDGHGHHQVSAIMAREAFAAAADPARFPEQIAAGLRPHRAAKLYQSLRGDSTNATVRLAIGNLDPLIGRSPFQLAMASRSRHRSQDMGRRRRRGRAGATCGASSPRPRGRAVDVGGDRHHGGRREPRPLALRDAPPGHRGRAEPGEARSRARRAIPVRGCSRPRSRRSARRAHPATPTPPSAAPPSCATSRTPSRAPPAWCWTPSPTMRGWFRGRRSRSTFRSGTAGGSA